MIELRDLQAGFSGRRVLTGVSLAFHPGRVLALLGPNGCGKTTLLRTTLGLLPQSGGEILYDGVPIHQLTSRQIAQRVSYLPQSRPVPNITARRMVLHGRFPYLSYPRRYRREDYDAAQSALAQADALDLADRPLPALSGGQRQKVYLAMALAQDTKTILMDEPTAFLDIRRQLACMRSARRLAQEGRAVVLVLHDICQALRWADEAAVLYGGGLAMCAPPEEIYLSGILDQVFGVTVGRVETESGWQYYCVSKEA